MLGREGNCCFSPLLSLVPFPPVLMHNGYITESKGETKGMGEPVGEGHAGLALPQCLLGIAKQPQRLRLKDERTHGRIVAILNSQETMLLRVVVRHTLFTVPAGSFELSHAE